MSDREIKLKQLLLLSKVVITRFEVIQIISEGFTKVNGRVVYDVDFLVTHSDIIEISKNNICDSNTIVVGDYC